MEIIGKNGRTYEVRFDSNEPFEIERDDETTGMRKVFVFQDFSIGTLASKRRETIFYSYDITPEGERINMKRHSFKDFESEFTDFLNSEIWAELKMNIVLCFLKKIEFTELSDNDIKI